MNRDMDVIRKILFAVRDSDTPITKVNGIPNSIYTLNAVLLIDEGLVIGNSMYSHNTKSQAPEFATLVRMTWQGADFLDSIRSDTVWKKVKNVILKPTGSWTFEILKKYIQHELETQLGLVGGS